VADEVRVLLTPVQDEFLDRAAEENIIIFSEFLKVRGQLMRSLEVALAGKIIDVEAVRQFGNEMGRLEADMTWAQAMAMLEVRNSMSEMQLKALLDMRAKYTGNKNSVLPQEPFIRGRQLFAQCALCHSDTSENSIGPKLTNITSRKIASDDSFENYSKAMKSYANTHQVWNEALLDDFLKSPRKVIPGTYMGYDGLEHSEDRAAMIVYLRARK